MTQKKILAADIGGTSSRFGLFTRGPAGKLERMTSLWLRTSEFSDFPSELRELEQQGWNLADVAAFVVAGAGPVAEGKRIKLTQVPWSIDLETLPYRFPLAKAVNDFVGQAFAALSPIVETADRIREGVEVSRGTKVVVGAGTGLGVAAITFLDDGRAVPLSSEGGHLNYAPETEREFRFLEFVSKKLQIPYPSWEDVLSGRGLSLTHEFFTGESLSPGDVASKLSVESETAVLFSTHYGRLCRNLALQYLAEGGVLIAGGIAAKNKFLVTSAHFVQSFLATRQHAQFLERVPLTLLDDQESGLWGAAQLGLELLERGSRNR